ncbi:unnamed protein product [Phaedon cochleariae]|uniref:CUB domain-containing protein n=1 Tax=Phaedon cochleariae TaxID=80249 RepID=A0A9N9X585_PHACE|nr:unnamed protein product [Phaedon cochleariae]
MDLSLKLTSVKLRSQTVENILNDSDCDAVITPCGRDKPNESGDDPDWFPGWPEYGNYNHQPNDDGLSEQDCVEARRMFALPHASHRLATTFMWNDRDCSTPNYFVCERLQSKDPLEHSWLPNCNRTVFLSRDQPKSLVSSPGFPRQYPDNANCDIDITATPGFRIILDFEELVLENESS